MLGRDDLLSAMTLECDVARHLFGRLPREDWQATLAYRPSPPQRSTLELLRYLSFCGIGGCRAVIEGRWEAFREAGRRVEELAAEGFPAAVDEQKRELTELLGSLSDGDLASRRAKNPLGHEMSLARALLEMPVRWLIGYRMQLFLYARALGAEVGTPDCWYGITLPPPGPR
jgi:hypothetical protein